MDNTLIENPVWHVYFLPLYTTLNRCYVIRMAITLLDIQMLTHDGIASHAM